MVVVTSGEGYDELLDAYFKGDVAPYYEISADFEQKRFLLSNIKTTLSIYFTERGVLVKNQRGKEDKKSRLEVLSLKDLNALARWATPRSNQEINNF